MLAVLGAAAVAGWLIATHADEPPPNVLRTPPLVPVDYGAR